MYTSHTPDKQKLLRKVRGDENPQQIKSLEKENRNRSESQKNVKDLQKSPKPPKMVGKEVRRKKLKWFREQLYTTKERSKLTQTARRSNQIRGISIVVRLVVSGSASRT